VEKIVEKSAAYQPGDPLDPSTEMGAIVDETQMNRILDYVESGQSEGAKLVVGGKRVMEETGGYYIPPTLFDKVANSMKIAREEIFGPVLSVIACKDVEDAIQIANDTPYGLAAGIWTRDITVAHRAARDLRAGFVYINTFDASDMSTPFGGYKESGFGRDKSLHAIDKYCELKTTWIELS
ncbi:MAG: aldehyde dehydrogenase family protein, partial [Proteobacteria bacterium]|nr:aldehyde dehydrogenase family protein [Pseudomonadota bacterium]